MSASNEAFSELRATERSRLRRRTQMGTHERAAVNRILDEALVAHVGFAVQGQPFVIPMCYGRDGDQLYLHGAASSRMLRALAEGAEACVEVTLLDGIVAARSAFHHSMNYRSAVLFGRTRSVREEREKERALQVLTEQILPGRWAQARRPTPNELRATAVVALAIDEGSVKSRQGGPNDDEADYALPVWAGQLPLRCAAGPPIDDKRLAPGAAVPDNVARYRRPSATA